MAGGLEERFERQPGYRGDIGKPPVLILERRKAQFGKTGHGSLAQWEDTCRLFGLLLEPLKLLQMRLGYH
jgi:hypothetical protein